MINLDKMEAIKEIISEQLPEDSDIVVEDMTNEDVIAYFIDSYEDITGCIGTNFESTQSVLKAVSSSKRAEEISIMGFDAGEEQLSAIHDGSLKGIVVQNPFGIGYASVVTAARKISGMEVTDFVDTGYIWVTSENIDSDTIKPMLYN